MMMLEKTRDFISKNIQWLLIGFICWLIAVLSISKAYGQTKTEVWNYIEQSDIQQKEIVYKQVLKETGHLKCTKCSLRFNNLLGFWNGERFLEFKDWRDSINFYINWQKLKHYDGGDYYEFLKQKWGAPDMDHYCETLKRIKI